VHPGLDTLASTKIKQFELGVSSAVPVLFHSGYLTIDKRVFRDTHKKNLDGSAITVEEFTFKCPNVEVGMHYKASLLERAFGFKDGYIGCISENLRSAIRKMDPEKTAEILSDLLYRIVRTHRRTDGRYFHSIFMGIFVAAGLWAGSDPWGRRSYYHIDVVFDNKAAMAVEVKFVKLKTKGGYEGEDCAVSATSALDSALNKAMNAIRDKHAMRFSTYTCKTIYLALAVRGKGEVAARYMTPDGTEGRAST
jgi:hypothetical protein